MTQKDCAISCDTAEPRRGIHRVAWNVVWNWAGMGVNVVAGFVVAPFLVHRLGDERYGLWILIAALIYYFSLLDMGVRGAVGRQIAFHRAKNDRERLNSTLATALSMLLAAGTVACMGSLLMQWLFFAIFHVPAEQVHDVRIALLLIGLSLAVWLPLNVFDAMLWAYQRFDLINAVDMTVAIARVALIFYFIGHGHGLVALALVQFLSQIVAQFTKGILIFRIDPALRLRWRSTTREAARGLLGIGVWHTLLCLAGVVNGQAGPYIIGAGLGVGMVTPFSIAGRLLSYGRDFVVASTGVLTPVAITFHASDQHESQRRLFLKGGKYCLMMAAFFLTLYLTLGRPMLHLWMGPKFEWTAQLLAILALGEFLPMSQWVSYSIILGKYRHRTLSIVALIENAIAVTLALLLVRRFGLVGVCVAFAVPGFLFRGVFQWIYVARLVHVGLRRFLMQVVLPVSAAAVPAGGALWALVSLQPPRSWVLLLLYGSVYALIYGLGLALMTGYDWLRLRGRGELAVSEGKQPIAQWLVSVIHEAW